MARSSTPRGTPGTSSIDEGGTTTPSSARPPWATGHMLRRSSCRLSRLGQPRSAYRLHPTSSPWRHNQHRTNVCLAPLLHGGGADPVAPSQRSYAFFTPLARSTDCLVSLSCMPERAGVYLLRRFDRTRNNLAFALTVANCFKVLVQLAGPSGAGLMQRLASFAVGQDSDRSSSE